MTGEWEYLTYREKGEKGKLGGGGIISRGVHWMTFTRVSKNRNYRSPFATP